MRFANLSLRRIILERSGYFSLISTFIPSKAAKVLTPVFLETLIASSTGFAAIILKPKWVIIAKLGLTCSTISMKLSVHICPLMDLAPGLKTLPIKMSAFL